MKSYVPTYEYKTISERTDKIDSYIYDYLKKEWEIIFMNSTSVLEGYSTRHYTTYTLRKRL